MRFDGGRWPCGWLRARCSERNQSRQMRMLLELAAVVSVPSLPRVRSVDAL